MRKRRADTGIARVKDNWLRAERLEQARIDQTAPPLRKPVFGKKLRATRRVYPLVGRDKWRNRNLSNLKARIKANTASDSDLIIWCTIGATMLAVILAVLALQWLRG